MIPSKKPVAALILVALCAHLAYSQTTTIAQSTADPGKSEFPRWARDIRRAEIVAFGAFPFMMFLATFSMDTYRASQNNWDSRYLPWPLKGAGAVEMTTDEYKLTMGLAAGGSLVIALVDQLLFQIKRARLEKQRLDLPEGELIILRKPWPAEDASPEEGAEDIGHEAVPGDAETEAPAPDAVPGTP
jgi:hypothetical protein